MPIKTKFITAQEAAGMIQDGMTVCPVGMTLVSAAESILKAIEQRFLETGHPRDLTYVHSCGQCDRVRGNAHLAHEHLVKRIIGSHWGLSPQWMQMISEEKVEAYCLPQGQVTHLYRAMACGKPGEISHIGLGTFIDPRIEGGKMNERTRKLGDISEIITIGGKEYMFYHAIPLDIVIIRGTVCDEMGNLVCDEEAMKLELLPAVMAVKRYGGKVIAQVKRVAQTGTLHPKQVVVPGVFIDAVVKCDNPEEDHRQTSSWYFHPGYCGDLREPMNALEPLPKTIRKVFGRRGVLEVFPGCIINMGTGIPNDVVGSIVAEEGLSDDVMSTVESGIYGGVQAGGVDFGIGKNLYAMIEHDKQFDYYNGAGVVVTYMGAGEMDAEGNINATKMGPRCTGAGGFVDITTNAKHVVFLSTFTASGLDVDFEAGKLTIRREGKIKKLVKKVAQISYNGQIARKNGQKMHFITERAVFELTPDGPMLTEIAEGIDLQRDVLDQMEFTPIISPNLKTISTWLYRDGVCGIRDYIINKGASEL